MKKLVYAFAVIMAVSFASCKTEGGSNNAEQAEVVVENTTGGDSLQNQAGDTTEVKAEETKEEAAPAAQAPQGQTEDGQANPEQPATK